MSASAVIGVVGNDVPRLLPLAAAAVPMRLTGSWDGPVDPAAQELLGASDLETVRILTELRAGAVHVDALVVCNDTQAHLRLFYVLRVTAPHLPLQLLARSVALLRGCDVDQPRNLAKSVTVE